MKARIAVFAIFLILLPFCLAFADDAATESNSTAAAPEAASAPGAASVSGEDNWPSIPNFSGEVGLSGYYRPVQGNPSKFNEYRDNYKGNVFGNIKLKYDDDKYWFYFKASDIGYDTQHYRLEGGVYGAVKIWADYNEIPHNYSLDDKTIYSGAGSNRLTLIPSFSNITAASWKDLDYSIKRQQEGGGVRLDVMKPFYLEFNANWEQRTGSRPMSATSNSPSGPISEFPQPINYDTAFFKGEVGYITKPLFLSAFVQYTDFTNNNDVLNFQNIYQGAIPQTATSIPNLIGRTDTITMPPSNKNYNYGFKGSVALPLNSRLNVSLVNGQTTSDASYLTSSLLATTNAYPFPIYAYPYAYGDNNWHGRSDTQNYSVVLNSNPIRDLNANIYYKYRGLQVNSDDAYATTNVGGVGNSNSSHDTLPVAYHKNDFGGDLSYKLPLHFVISGGYNYVDQRNSVSIMTGGSARNTYDIPKTTDNIYNIGLKWAGVDFMSAKVGYERMDRSGANASDVSTATEEYAMYHNEFNMGSQKRDKIKANLDFFPIDNLDVGFGYNYKKSTYPDTLIGLRNTRTNEYYVDASYTFGKWVRVGAYLAYEDYKQYQFFRKAVAANQDPNSPTQDNLNYNFDLTTKDRSFDYGVGVDIYVIPKIVTLKLQYDSVHSYGNGDYTVLNQAALYTLGTPTTAVPIQNNDNLDIPSIDSYKLDRISAKVLWNVTKAFGVVVGYAWEKYKYDDYALNDYPGTYTYTDSTNNVNYLTGAYSNPNYTANVFFLSLNYKF